MPILSVHDASKCCLRSRLRFARTSWLRKLRKLPRRRSIRQRLTHKQTLNNASVTRRQSVMRPSKMHWHRRLVQRLVSSRWSKRPLVSRRRVTPRLMLSSRRVWQRLRQWIRRQRPTRSIMAPLLLR